MHEEFSNKKIPDPKKEKEMSFWEHLEELRSHIFRALAAVIVFSIVAFIAKRFIFETIILAPKSSDFITNRLLCRLSEILSVKSLCMGDMNLNIQNISMSGQFMTHMYVSMISGLILASPFVLWEFWRFVKPALQPNERKYSRGAVVVSSMLFLTGVLFAYFLIVPLTINFFATYQVSPEIPNQIQLDSYISTIVSVVVACGIVFELPILVYFLTKIGIITPTLMKKNRKIMLVIVLAVSAIITPPDIFSQILVSIPLIGLYEVSISISKRVYKARQEDLAG